METTHRRITLALTKQDQRELKALIDHFEENQTQVIKRALILLHYITFMEGKVKKK